MCAHIFSEVTLVYESTLGKVLSWCLYHSHNCDVSDVIMVAMASQITSLTIVYSTFIQVQIKENINAPRHWSLYGEFTGHQWSPRSILRGKCFHLMTSSLTWIYMTIWCQQAMVCLNRCSFITFRPRQNGRHFADDTFKRIFSKPISEPMVVRLTTHICFARLEWVIVTFPLSHND